MTQSYPEFPECWEVKHMHKSEYQTLFSYFQTALRMWLTLVLTVTQVYVFVNLC